MTDGVERWEATMAALRIGFVLGLAAGVVLSTLVCVVVL